MNDGSTQENMVGQDNEDPYAGLKDLGEVPKDNTAKDAFADLDQSIEFVTMDNGETYAIIGIEGSDGSYYMNSKGNIWDENGKYIGD